MKLLTKTIKEKMVKNHNDQDGTKDFKAVLKLFDPTGASTWYLSELNPDDNIAFGLCDLGVGCPELGYVSLDELSTLKVKMGLGIERDLYFTPKTFDELQKVA
tara:strand:+ start:107 stop:415 length:309 start_codon:yes stop_codon:yes gene_type:complete